MQSLLSFFKIRPASKVTFLFILGLIVGFYFDISPSILFILISALFIAAILFLCVKVPLLNFVLIIGLILSGILSYELATNVFPENHISRFADLNETMNIVGHAAGFPHQKNERIELEVEIDSITVAGKHISTCGKALVRLWRLDFRPGYGDRVRLIGKIKGPRSERNPGEFNYKNFLAANGIYGIIDISEPQNVILQNPSHKKSVPYFINVIKRKFYLSLNYLYAGKARALVKALLLGERGEISPELKDAFARCGVIHALAISGLHIGYIGVIFFVFFSLLRFNYQARIIAVLISVFCYALLIGFEPPIVRASLMMGILLIGRLIQRQTDIFNVISTAALIILIINPQELFQASFQLSFAAILSIVYLYQSLKTIFEKWSPFVKLTQNKIGEYAGTLFLVSVAAQLGTLPIVAFYFGRIPLIAFVLNLVVIPVVGIVIALGFATLACSLISLPLAQFYTNTNTVFLEYLIRVIEIVSKIKFSTIEIGRIGLITILAYYFLLWLIINFNKKTYRKTLLYSTIAIALFFLWQPIFKHQKWMEVIYFDVGQGDAALMKFPDGKNLLIDAGPKLENFDAGSFFIVPYFKREWIRHLDGVILSHSDNDHVGGMPSIFRKIPVEAVFDNGLYQSSSVCSTYQFLIDSLQIQHQIVEAGEQLKNFENYGLYIIHPCKSFMKKFDQDVNNCSIVVKIVFGKISFLFPGDIEQEAEEILLNYGNLLRSDVLKIAHHGSQTSSTSAWLDQVQPQFAVISVGKNNRFNFPAPSVLKRLNQLGIQIIRTDLNGAAVFRTDGNVLERIR